MMRPGLFILYLFTSFLLGASGQQESYEESKESQFHFEAVQDILIKGQIAFRLEEREGPWTVTVKANPALMDQIKVENWFGSLWIKIDTGQFGAREKGEADILIQGPRIPKITIDDQAYGTLTSKKTEAIVLAVRGKSRLDAQIDAKTLTLNPTWSSLVVLKGRVELLEVLSKGGSTLQAEQLNCKVVKVQSDQGSEIHLKSPKIISGQLRGKSKLTWEPGFSPEDISNLAIESQEFKGPRDPVNMKNQ